MAETAENARPSAAQSGAVWRWARANLFSGWLSSCLTVLALAALLLLIPDLVQWATLDATWSGTRDDCRAGAGACWALIVEKYRFILFGFYPPDEQWRPFAAILLLFAALGLSMWRRCWRRWLFSVWLLVFGVIIWLLSGGLLGLTFVPLEQWGGLPLTLILSVVCILVAFPFSVFLALGRRSSLPVIRALCTAYIELIRGVPLITLLFMASVMLPLFLPEGVTINKILRAQLAMIFFAAAYLAEVVRGGLQAIPRGQYEAANALGLGYWQTMRLVILPQALVTVIPPIVNTFIGIFKDTSLVVIIGLFDLLSTTKAALSDPAWRGFPAEAYLFAAAIYFVFCYGMSRYSRYLETVLRVGAA